MARGGCSYASQFSLNVSRLRLRAWQHESRRLRPGPRRARELGVADRPLGGGAAGGRRVRVRPSHSQDATQWATPSHAGAAATVGATPSRRSDHAGRAQVQAARARPRPIVGPGRVRPVLKGPHPPTPPVFEYVSPRSAVNPHGVDVIRHHHWRPDPSLKMQRGLCRRAPTVTRVLMSCRFALCTATCACCFRLSAARVWMAKCECVQGQLHNRRDAEGSCRRIDDAKKAR